MPQAPAFLRPGAGRLLSALIISLALLGGSASAAPSFDTAAPSAILVDYRTGTVLLDKNADAPVPPASLTKLMTLEVLFHEIKEGRVNPQGDSKKAFGGEGDCVEAVFGQGFADGWERSRQSLRQTEDGVAQGR